MGGGAWKELCVLELKGSQLNIVGERAEGGLEPATKAISLLSLTSALAQLGLQWVSVYGRDIDTYALE